MNGTLTVTVTFTVTVFTVAVTMTLTIAVTSRRFPSMWDTRGGSWRLGLLVADPGSNGF